MKLIIAVAGALALTGCATGNGFKAQVLGANIDIAKTRAVAAAKPILDAEIPTPNGVMRIVVHAPQTPGNGQVAMPDDPWGRVADRAVGVLGTAAGLYLGGQAAVSLVTAAGTGITHALQVQPAPTVVNQPTPLAINQPAPIVITQPEPIVITQPEPIIITAPDPIIISPPAP
jgi:hypothetical protein